MHRDRDDHASGGTGLPGRTAGGALPPLWSFAERFAPYIYPCRSSARSSPLWSSCFDAARTGARRLPREGACRFRCSDPGMDELTEALPEEAAPILSGVSPEELPQESVWRTLLRTAWEKVRSSAADICRTGGILLCVCVLVSLTDTLDLGSRAPPYITFAAVAVIGTATISDLRSYLSLGTETLQTLSDYSTSFCRCSRPPPQRPGRQGSAAAKYAATAVCMDVLLSVARSVLVPCVCGYAALSVADAAVGNEILKPQRRS